MILSFIYYVFEAYVIIDKLYMRPRDRQEKAGSNNLVNRLFKNKNLKTRTPSLNITVQHGLDAPSSTYLIPRITKPKLKPIEADKRLRSKIFSHHDTVFDLQKHESKPNILNVDVTARSQALSKVRSKIYSLIDDSYHVQQPKRETEIEEKPFLTPQDFMEILKIDREMSEEFCYMNRRSSPYDWQIVEFDKKDPNEYMVISKRGLTKYFNNEAQFMKFEQYLEEQKIYNSLNNIDYFRLYAKKKHFQVWKKYTSMVIFKERSKQFGEQTLLGDNHIKQAIVESRRICRKIQNIETFYCQTISSMSMEDFHLYVENEKNKTISKIKGIENSLLQMIREKVDVSMSLYMKKMRISNDKNQSNSERKIPLLIGDETGKDMPYTKEATIRTHQERVRNMLKLIDYLIITVKTELLLNMTDFLTNTINDITAFYESEKKSFSSNSWMVIELTEQDQIIMFNPDEQTFFQQLEDIIMGTLSDICSNHFQFLHLPEFDQFWKCKIQSEKSDEYIQLKKIIQNNKDFNQKFTQFKCTIKTCFNHIKNYTAIFDNSLVYLRYMRELFSLDFDAQNVDFFKEIMGRSKEEMTRLNEIQNVKEVGIISLNCGTYKQVVEKMNEDLNNRIHASIPNILQHRSETLLSDIKINYDLISFNPLTIQEYIQFLKNTIKVTDYFENTQPIIADNSMLLTLSQSYSIKINESIKSLIGQANGQMIGLSRRLTEIEKNSNDLADKFKKEIQKLIPTFRDRIKAHGQKLSSAELLKSNEELGKKLIKINDLSTSLAIIIGEKNELKRNQEELGLQVTDFEDIDTYENNFKNIESLYEEKKRWTHFLQKTWKKLINLINFEETKRYLETITKKIAILIRELEPNEVLQLLNQDVDAFKPLFYSVEASKNKFLEEKHYSEMRTLVRENMREKKFVKDPNEIEDLFKDFALSYYNFEYFKDLEFQKYRDEFVQLAIQAEKEAQLIEMITRVENIWRALTITTVSFKEGKDGNILGNNDELITKIDDNIMIVNNILASKYVGSIKHRVDLQSKMLRYVQDLMDEWYLHQKNWIYLEPIFKSPFAMKNLPKETAMFGQIDVKWKVIMKQAKDSINIKKYADEYTSNYTLKVLKNNNDTFDSIQKTLENFLEKKRDLFQRFYFLSNDQLLQILSTVKAFEQIEPHLRKVFQNFVSIRFDDKGIPTSMVSMEGEEVVLRNCIFRGEVEEWFRNCEESMKGTLKSIVRQGILKYTEEGVKRSQWVKMFPSQVILVVDCIMWTTITEGYLQNLDENDISEWYETNVTQLNQLVEMIRTDLSSLDRKTLVALITQDVHFRDIIQNLQSCQSIHDFKWLQQLRFYNQSENVLARQVQSELYYGYEYLGATTRLVITPLTDRCWITITGALHIKLGANPAGPAGTGKTESCKDLAKSLARYCIVFNCSDQINATMMQKLFSGLAYTGSWTCLDEFNRIDIEVLSVISQQVLTIREALLLGKHNKQLILGGKTIHLNHDLGIFITMNPGYAGRTELPDNLKTLFRPVSMMVPDYTLIAEIMLFSEGFASAKQLSKKMTKLYKLSSEQLSKQDHYDFGMRAVKSVLVMAGGLKRAEPDVPEDIILIRAMQDSNVPKFLSHDIPLFNGIIEDMFPGVKIPKRNQEEMITYLENKCGELHISPTNTFIQKNLQLSETLKVRFGVMLVGPPMGGKTSIIKTLLPTFPMVINPKAVSLAELYGNFDTMTQTWTDGLAAKLLRQSATSHEYLIFDGPVDAVWVENLNTVLDDSRMLCLSNGERIKLSEKMRILFEVNDLNQASPATVSRCGMVWVSEEVVDWQQLIICFFEQSKIIQNQQKLHFLINLVRVSFRKGITAFKKYMKEVVNLNTATLAHSYCKFVKNMMKIVTEQALNSEVWKKALEKVCVFSYVWSIGAIVSEQSKSRFDKSLSDCFSAESLKSPAQNFTLNFKDRPDGEWISWNMLMTQFQFPEDPSYLEIFVPTKETFCYSTIMERFISQLNPVFLTSPTGTGKTSIINQVMKKSGQSSLSFTFTAQTSPSVAQIQFQSKLQNLRKHGSITLVPPPGKKFIYFIDDINMPAIQEYGAQPPIEMLRLLLGSHGVWDRKNHIFKLVQGVEMIISGTFGRTELPPRFIRFFNTIYLPELEEESLVLIFSEITRGFFQRFKIKNEIMELITNKSIVNSTLNLYAMVRAELLPTPEKSHYSFNLRDVSRVFQGLSLVKQSTLSSPEVLVKLWVHEFQRVFEDRLINEKDKMFIREELGKKVAVSLKSHLTQETLFESPIFFCSFLRKGQEKKDWLYEQAKDYTKLLKIISDVMSDETNMNLVLFSDAVAHVTRVARALQFDSGHILLVGLSGSGKKSMITLGGVVSQCKLHQIEVKKNYGKLEFREDIFRIMKEAAFQNNQVCFLFPENHIIEQSFLEDINNLLSSGQIPCMFTKDNLEEINQTMGYQNFLKKIIKNLHVTITLSPVGGQFRTRLRNYPSLINCCSMDWVDKWPEEALLGVATMKLEDKSVCDVCVYAHKQIEILADNFFTETRRKVFVTSKHYISLIETFNHLLNQQRLKIDGSIGKLSNGVHKLEEANNLIQNLKIKLTEMQPILATKTVEQENLLKKLEIDREEASKVKIVVQEEEKLILQKTEKAMDEKKEADKILNEALPTLHAANEALNTLNRNDISEIKMNQNPHAQVKFTLESVSILLQEKEDWESVRKTISDINFISRLKSMDVYHIPMKVQQAIKAKLKTNPNFKPNQIKQINFAAKSFCEWILAVVSFNEVNKQIVKKKDVVKKLNDELAISNKQLQAKRDELNKIVSKVKELEALFIASKEEKEKLDNEIILTKNRLINAEELTVGLKNEKVRWNEYLIQLNQEKTCVIGNTFLSTCFVVYAGPYSGKFRQFYMSKMIEKTTQLEIKTHQTFQLKNVLGDNLQIADWINFSLPKDEISINNAIIVKRTMQNPIMIDPQLQASKWIRNMQKKNEIVQLKIGADNLLKRLQTILRMKYPILLEMPQNIIDPALENLLSKDYECVNHRYYTKVGESRIQIDKDLKIYVYTKIANPAFNPEVFIKLCVINFTVTPEGLEDQLLGDVVENQIPEVQTKKRELVLTISKGRLTLAKNQDKILALLNNSQGFILDDVQLIHNLKESKKVSAEVNASLQESVVKSLEIQKAREVYKPVSVRGALLYLIVTELSSIQAMYQFSLEYFNRIFKNVLVNTKSTESTEERVQSLMNVLTQTIYMNISRALFNQHKNIFSFIIACRINKIPKLEYDYCIKGNFSLPKLSKQKPDHKSTKEIKERKDHKDHKDHKEKEVTKPISGLSTQINDSLQNLKRVFPNNLQEYFSKDKQRLTLFYQNPLMYSQSEVFLKDHQQITPFQSLLMVKILKPEFTVEAINHFIKQSLGNVFVDSNSPTMQQIYNDTVNKVPLNFILSVGADPLQNLLRMAKDKGKKTDDISIISLGQGQGPPALRAIQSSTKEGKWVIIQNCHLGKSFLPTLEKKLQQINESEEINTEFRLFLTVMPCSYFPISILQNSLKVTSEPPRGIKSNLKKLVNSVTWGQTDEQKTFAFNLCVFHSIVLERRKFGSLGWNILYDFNQSDLETSLTVVSNLINSYDDIPFDAIEYFVGEIIFGGRVTDQFDRRLLKTQLYDYISFQSIDKPQVKAGEPNVYDNYIQNLNDYDGPNMFGLNENAQKTYMMKITNETLEAILLLEPQQVNTAGGSDQTVSLINEILTRMPSVIKKNQDKKTFDAIDICLLQESVRFNKLIHFMDKSLKELLLAIKGEAIMTDVLEKIFISLNLNQVPKEWEKRAYPSTKHLSSWFEDFLERVKFIRNGVLEKPKMYWISAFYFPQGFLTSVLQIFARKTKLPVDSLSFSFMFRQYTQKQSIEGAPTDGCLIYGLYSEACCIDFKSSSIKESPPNVLDSEVPVIHFKPVQTAKQEINFTHYECPLYKTKKRAGTLSTTGHSTNYIISIVCKSDVDDSHWIKRGAAFFCSLDK